MKKYANINVALKCYRSYGLQRQDKLLIVSKLILEVMTLVWTTDFNLKFSVQICELEKSETRLWLNQNGYDKFSRKEDKNCLGF